MIKNIVFDMGKVLVEYQADAVARHFVEDEAERQAVTASVFVSPEWLMLDMGVLTEEEGLARMQSRLPDRHAKEMAAQCFWHWHEYNMWPVKEMGQVVRKLKARGFGIYLCSNASVRLLSCYQRVIPAVDCFDGILFSAQERCMKPQREIYERLFERFGLRPEECFFIDDQELNIKGAADCGMEGYCFADGDVRRLAAFLEKLPDPES